MKLNAYLHFNGNCDDAFSHYEKVFGVKRLMRMTYGQMPPGNGPVTPGVENRIMHTRIQVGSALLMGSDAPPDRFQASQGFSVNVGCETPQEAERVFKALGEGGQAILPMAETFFAHRFGMLRDRFGIAWMVTCEKTA